jgi:hypothetical protein
MTRSIEDSIALMFESTALYNEVYLLIQDRWLNGGFPIAQAISTYIQIPDVGSTSVDVDG